MRTALAALRVRNFRLFWIGGLISNTGRWFQVLAIPAIIWQLTESAAWVGFAGFAQMFPMALIGPVAGALADRHDRRRLLLVTQLVQASTTAVLWAMWVTGVRSPSAFVVVSALAGLSAGLNLPGWQAYVTELVPRDLMLNAITLNSMGFNSARMIGPVLAGVSLASLGAGWAFFVNFISFGAVVVALMLLDTRSEIGDRPDAFTPIADFVETLAYIRSEPGISSAISVVMLIGLFGMPLQVLSVVFAEDVFDRGSAGFGLMLTMMGAGAVLAAPFVAGRGKELARSRLQTIALGGYAIGVIGVALAPSFAVALVAMMITGASHLTSASLLNTAIQLQVDEGRRAKVLSVYIMTLTLASPVGQLSLGQLIDSIGPRPAVLLAGVTMLAAGMLLLANGRFAALDGERTPVTS